MKHEGIKFLLLWSVPVTLLAVAVYHFLDNAILALLTFLIPSIIGVSEVHYTKKQYDLERKKECTKALEEFVIAPLREVFHKSYINERGNLVISVNGTLYEVHIQREFLKELPEDYRTYPIVAFILKACRETTNIDLPATLVYDLLENHSPYLKELFWNVILSHNVPTALEQIRDALVELTSKDIFLEPCYIPNERELNEKVKKYEHLFTLSEEFLY